MNLTQKISQMTPKGADLDATDLIEVSTIVGGSYVTKSITGQELIDAIPAPTGFVPETRTLTINGVAQDLSADRSWTISTGLTVGTTPISSGTIGRVLFQGTGNVLQQSSSLFWDNTNARLELTTADNVFATFLKASTGQLKIKPYLNPTFGVLMESRNAADSAYLPFTISGSKIQLADGNVLINTTTDAGFRLDVNGTARVQDNLTVSKNQNATTNISVVNTDTTNASSRARVSVTSGTIIGSMTSIIGNDFYLGTESAHNVNFTTAGTTRFNLINSTGNLNIGTLASDIGARLGVRGSGSTSATKTLLVRNLANTDLLTIWDDGAIGVNTSTNAGFRLDVNGTARVVNSITAQSFIATNNGSSFMVNGYAVLDYGDGCRINYASGAQKVTIYSNVSGGGMSLHYSGNVSIGSTATEVTSAILNVPSTTKGFLPPRMTTTQKNAIASPATGLQVYDTTLNRPCFYDGTTWITL